MSAIERAAWAEDFAYLGTGTLGCSECWPCSALPWTSSRAAYGAKRYKASARAVLGATVGAVVGIFFGPVGALLGPFVGAIVGELTHSPDLPAAGRAGVGAMLGLVLGAAAKLAIGVAMICVALAMRLL